MRIFLLMLLLSTSLIAQRSIDGVVLEQSSEQPLMGVNIIKKNTNEGVTSDFDGKFTLNNVLPGATNTLRLNSIAEVKAGKTNQSVDEVLGTMAQQSPMQRIAQPNEVAEAIAFLASDRASYINGINIPVDGGRTKSL